MTTTRPIAPKTKLVAFWDEMLEEELISEGSYVEWCDVLIDDEQKLIASKEDLRVALANAAGEIAGWQAAYEAELAAERIDKVQWKRQYLHQVKVVSDRNREIADLKAVIGRLTAL